MPATVAVDKRTVVHAASNGIGNGFPDVCLTPTPPGPPVPMPYPNLAMSSACAMGTITVTCDMMPIVVQGSMFAAVSSGDEPGSLGGVVSHTIKGAAQFVSYSFDVMAESKPVARQADLLTQNMLAQVANTPPAPEVQPPLPGPPGDSDKSKDDDKNKNKLTLVNLKSKTNVDHTPPNPRT